MIPIVLQHRDPGVPYRALAARTGEHDGAEHSQPGRLTRRNASEMQRQPKPRRRGRTDNT